MGALVVLVDAVIVGGLLMAAYRSFKVIGGAAEGIEEARAALLQFWVLFAVLHFVAGIFSAYTRELKLVVVIACNLPSHGAKATPAIVSSTIGPLFRKYGPPVEKRITWLRRRVIGFISLLHLSATSGTLKATLPSATTSDLHEVRKCLEESLGVLARERRTRRTRRLKHSRERLGGTADGANGVPRSPGVRDGKVVFDSGSDGEGAGTGTAQPSAAVPSSDESDDDVFLSSDEDDYLHVRRRMMRNAKTPGEGMRQRRRQMRYSTGGL